MRKHTLTILWAIIISGSIFVIANKLRPQVQAPRDTAPIVEEDENPDLEVIEIEEPIDNKSFSEHIKDGDQYFEDAYYEIAIKEYKRASEQNENSTEALKKLAEAYIKNNQGKDAEKTFIQALSLAPNSQEIKLGVARALLSQRKIDEAKTLIWELPAEYPEARFYQAITLIVYGKSDEAKALFEELLGTIPEANIFLDKYETNELFKESDPLFLELMLAYSIAEIGEYQAAIPKLFEIIDQKNNYRDAWIVLGYCYLNIDKTEDAIDALLQAKEFDDEKPETLFYLALAYFANDELEKTIYYLEKAKSNGFQPIDILELKLAEAYEARKDYNKAALKYEKVIQSNPSSVNLFANVVKLYTNELNDSTKGLALANKALNLFPTEAMSFNLLGLVYTERGDYNKAKSHLSNAIKIDPKLADAYLNMAKLQEVQGHYLLSKEYYKQAYTLGHNTDIGSEAAAGYNHINKLYKLNISKP